MPISNSAFLAAVGEALPSGAMQWVTGFQGNPDLTDSKNWSGHPYSHVSAALVDGWTERNTYFSVAALRPTADGQIRRRKANFARLLVLVADDVEVDSVPGPVSYVLATSPGKVQVGILLDGEDEDASNLQLVDRLVTTMADRGMLRADISGNNAVRYVRLPIGQNQKPREQGAWTHEMRLWAPSVRLSLDDAAAALGIDLDGIRGQAATPGLVATALGPQDERLRVLTANVIRGEGLHESLNQIAASLVASGTAGGAAVNLLRGLMDASLAPKDERWLARYNDIPRSVTTAQEKFSQAVPGVGSLVEQGGLLLSVTELDRRAASLKWAVKGAVPANTIGMVFGASGSFKSFIALDYALHRCYGMPWLGRKTKQAIPIYIAAEGGAGLMKRIRAWHKERGMDPLACPMRVVITPLSLTTQAGALREAIEQSGAVPGDIVIDTMSQTFSGEENSAKEVSEFFRQLGESLRVAFEATVLIVHHTGHGASDRARGSSAIEANIDFQLHVEREEGQLVATLACVKQKEDDRFEPVPFILNRVVLGVDEDGDEITSLVANYADQANQLLAATEKATETNNGLFIRLAREMGDEQLIDKEFRRVLRESGKTPKQIDPALSKAKKHARSCGFVFGLGGSVQPPSENLA